MTSLALHRPAYDDRRRHQARVAALLEAIDERRRELYRLRANGATRAAVVGHKEELKEIRRTLAATVASGGGGGGS